jgi:hypothetical protein
VKKLPALYKTGVQNSLTLVSILSQMNSIPSYFFKVHFNIMFPTYYILVKQRFKNSIKDVKTLPGADIDFDCHLLVAKICTRLNQIIWFRKGKPRRVGKVVCSMTESALEKSGYVR